MVRDHDPRDSGIDRPAGIDVGQDSLGHDRQPDTTALTAQPFEVAPVERLVELLAEGPQARRTIATGTAAAGNETGPEVGERQPLRKLKPVAHLGVADADEGRVDREHDRGVARGHGAGDQLTGEASVLLHVELEPAGDAGRGDVLERRGGQGRRHHHRPQRLGRSRRGQFAFGVGQAMERGGRDQHRKRHLGAEHRCGGVDGRDIDQHPFVEPPTTERRLVLAQRPLGQGAADVVVVRRGRQPKPSRLTKVVVGDQAVQRSCLGGGRIGHAGDRSKWSDRDPRFVGFSQCPAGRATRPQSPR